MDDAFYSWLLVFVLAELSALFFFLYLRLGETLPRRLFFAMLSTCAAVFTLLAVAVTLSEGPSAWAPEDGAILSKTALLFSGLLVIAVYAHISGSRASSFSKGPFTIETANAPKKGSCLMQGLGCLVVGPLLLAAFVFLIGALTMFAP